MYAKHLIISMENVQDAIKDLVLQMELALRVLPIQANAQKKMQQQAFAPDALMEVIYLQAQRVFLWIPIVKHLTMLLTSVIIVIEVMDKMFTVFVNRIV